MIWKSLLEESSSILGFRSKSLSSVLLDSSRIRLEDFIERETQRQLFQEIPTRRSRCNPSETTQDPFEAARTNVVRSRSSAADVATEEAGSSRPKRSGNRLVLRSIRRGGQSDQDKREGAGQVRARDSRQSVVVADAEWTDFANAEFSGWFQSEVSAVLCLD